MEHGAWNMEHGFILNRVFKSAAADDLCSMFYALSSP
jgi:hypothetical protein